MVTCAVARLDIDWPWEQVPPKHSKLDSGKLAHSLSKLYSSCVFMTSTSIYLTVVGAGLLCDAPCGRDACGISLP